ncbi:hypothetical protein U5640_16335 [Streptomyces sp. SS7]|uniref:hypothetical protein n=1 Tax=Streptomyces sp. SS7 TaxID=3108485 RepID=UPI0030EF2B22
MENRCRLPRAGSREAVTGRDAVLLALSWDGVEEMPGMVDESDAVLQGMPSTDPTNVVTHGVGTLLTEHGEAIAGPAPGAPTEEHPF